MIDQFIEALQKYGDPKKSNRVLGLDFVERFSYDEQDRLVDRLSDNSEKIHVRQLYDAFGIKPEEAQIVKQLGEVDTLADIVGTYMALDLLGIKKVYFSKIRNKTRKDN